MKKLFYTLMAALMVLVAASCDKDKPGNDDPGNNDPGNNEEPEIVEPNPSVKTQEPTEIDAFSACLHAQIDFAGIEWSGVNYGFFWGTSEDAEGTYLQADGQRDENEAYSAKITGLSPETEYWFKAFVEIDGKPYTGEILHFTTEKNPVPVSAVDLGIVMTRKDGSTYKLYWAQSNLCESGLCPNIEDYGDYYAWGETDPHYSSLDPLAWKDGKTGYTWSTYQWCDGTQSTLTKYNTYGTALGVVDNIGELQRGENEGETIDDVARAKLGGKWRMPTRDEFRALFNNCSKEWVTVNGHVGLKLTSTITDYTEKWIFLPAAGLMSEESYSYHGKSGYYWSSSLYAIPVYSCIVSLAENNISAQDNYRHRYCGLTVRPVWEE